MNGLDLVGITLLAVVGFAFLAIGTRARDRKLDLNLGRFNVDNVPPAEWDAMNRRAGNATRRGGAAMAATALILTACAVFTPAGVAGAAGLLGSIVGSVATTWSVAGCIEPPARDWHP